MMSMTHWNNMRYLHLKRSITSELHVTASNICRGQAIWDLFKDVDLAENAL